MMNHVVRRGRRTRPLSLRLLLCAFSLFIVSNVDSADSQERPPAIDRTDSGRETLDLLASKGALIYPATKPNGTVSVSLLRPGDDDAFWRGSDADMALLARLPYVAVLHMNCTIKDQKALRFLAQMPALKRLVDTGCSIRDDGMARAWRSSKR